MNFSKTNKLLCIVLAAIIILIAAIAVADRVIHANSAIAVPGPAAEPALQTDVKTGTRIGFAAPDFTLPTTDDSEFKLSDYRGKNVILNFWATWCGPCRIEIPAFKEIHDKYSDSGTVIVAVNCLDNPDSALLYATTNGMDFVIPLDPRGVVSDLYNIRGMPTTYFINEKGVITSIKIGPFINTEEIEERLNSFK